MNDLNLIKKYYGEAMMHLCRKLFPTILEIPGLLISIMEKNFAHNKFLYDDIISQDMIMSFRNYIYSFTNMKLDEVTTEKNPFELLEEKGYTLYECKTDKEVNTFRKYYTSREEICTFDSDRLDECYVFFAVKKDVDKIKRENFKNPTRQDEYGTSVISIQFTKGDINILSIKNRYNHSVDNPDATFSNNLDLIIPGLTYSFERFYNYNINSNYKGNFELGNYVTANDNKMYRYNYHINGIYYCDNNVIIDSLGNVITKYKEKEKYIVFDYFVLDIVNKKIFLHDMRIKDSFKDRFNNIVKIDIRNNKEKNTRVIEIIFSNSKSVFIEINEKNQIIGYVDNDIKTIDNNFLYCNKTLKVFNTPNVEEIGNSVLEENLCLTAIFFPLVKKIGNNFLYQNVVLNYFDAPNLNTVGTYFLYQNNNLLRLELLNLQRLGDFSLYQNDTIKELIIPNLGFMTDSFKNNTVLENLYAPRMRYICRNFLSKHNKRKIILKSKKELEVEKAKKQK